ncbi:MAG: hypothetical protein A2W22_06315 [Candidatus Levybacteria bacterium RBG_16_35_11]|nr:MAG: hypothetical protein A2W22_06315 [Candidatus Levybacteria bacterium RBG_16_35_11]
MNYSFHCKECGETIMSDDKKEITEKRKNHKYITNLFTKAKMCNMIQTPKGTWMRPSLYWLIKAEAKGD